MRKKIMSLLLVLCMIFTLLPITPVQAAADVGAVYNADSSDTAEIAGSVHVTVENTTFTSEEAAWTGTLVDKDVNLYSDSTMMTCVVDALGEYSQTGAENNYISEINGLEAFDGGSMSGWMGTLNDWFTNEGFGGYTVANKGLQSGDVIRIMYTCNGYGADLGADFYNTSTAVKALSLSTGSLDKAFDKGTYEYTLTVPADTTGITVIPTAENKNYQVRVFSSAAEALSEKCTADSYKLGTTDAKAFNSGIGYLKTVPVASDGETIIKVVCGDPDWPGSGSSSVPGVYTITVKFESEEPELVETGTDENIVWSFYNDGTLTLSAVEGSDGAMNTAYSTSSSKRAPWVKSYASDIQNVVIEEGVTTISNYAFYLCANLKTVEIPASLTGISDHAFYKVTSVERFTAAEGGAFTVNGNFLMKETTVVLGAMGSLSGSVTIPEGVTELGNFALFNDADITSVTLPDGLTIIGESAVDGCSALTSINIPSTVTTILNDAFFETAITSIVIPEGVTAIESNTFYGCENLESVSLPSTLTSIGKYAFKDTAALKQLTIPSGVTEIGEYVFPGSGLTSINIPEGVTSIGQYAFQNCVALESVSLPGTLTTIGQYAFNGCSKLKAIVIPEGVTSIDQRAFRNCSELESVSFPSTLTTLGANAFENCTKLTTITAAEGGAFTCTNGMLINGTEIVLSAGVSGDLVIPDGITTIAANVFKGNTAITSVSFPDSLTSIGQTAFSGCTGITGKITIPGTITTIAYAAFGNCSGITEVYMEDLTDPANTSFGSVFSDCDGITTVRLPANLKTYSNLFAMCDGIEEIELPEGLESINNQAFSRMNGLKRLVIPASVKTFTGYFIYNCSSIEYVEFKSLEKFTNGMFYNLPNLKLLVLPDNLTGFTYNSSNAAPKVVAFYGTEEQWEAATTESVRSSLDSKGIVVLCNYNPEAVIAPPTITRQPQNEEIIQYSRYKLTIEVEEQEGFDYRYEWYLKTDEGDVKAADGKEGAINTGTTGSLTYYCLIKYYGNGGMGEVRSEEFTITIKENDIVLPGSGTEEDPYLISTAEQLNYICALTEFTGETWSSKYMKLAADITLPDGWKPIGCTIDGTNNIQSGNNLYPFSGTLDGDGHTVTVPKGGLPLFGYVKEAAVKNLKIYGEEIAGYGLVNNFEGVGLSGSAVLIDNVTLVSGTRTLKSGLIGANVTTNGYAGCSAGFTAVIQNCTIEEGCVIGYDGNQSQIGSFAGRMQGTVTNCVSYATVKGVNYVGGIIGTKDNAMGQCIVENCTFKGSVISTGSYAGGIVGGGYSNNNSAPNGARPSIIGCTASGTVQGNECVGGITGGDRYVAQTWDNVIHSVTGNTFTGTISGSKYVGGVIGYYNSLNRYDIISGNTYISDCGADKGIGAVAYVDTSHENPTAVEGTLYFSTKDSVADCPVVEWCSWKLAHNRTDDPLGADMDNLARAIDPLAEGYTVSMDADKSVTVGEIVEIPVTIGHTDEAVTKYNAYDMTFSYDADILALNMQAVETEGYKVVPGNGTVQVVRYGDEAELGEALKLSFTAKATGTANVILTEAFADNAANAIGSDAPAAAIIDGTTAVNISGYTVTLPDDFTTEEADLVVEPGGSFTFKPKDANYNYKFSVTVGGTTTENLTFGDNGTYTIENINGNVTVSITEKTGKTFQVTLNGDLTGKATAVYQTDYTFTLNKADGYAYNVQVTIGGTAYTGFSAVDNNGVTTYTIPGTDITGDIVINDNKTVVTPESYSVTFTGSGAGDIAEGTAATVVAGEDYTFTLKKAAGYAYTVTAAIGGESVTVTEDENDAFTVAGVTGDLTINIEKVSELSIEVSVNSYVELDSMTMYLVTAEGTPADGKAFAYDGNVMYRTTVYGENVYSWLVIVGQDEDVLTVDAAMAKITAVEAAAEVLEQTYDVNGTNVADVNDAQLVYDIYNGKYSDFETVTVKKFLRADVNGNKTVNSADAVAVVHNAN